MPSSARSLRRTLPRLLVGCLILAACTDSTAPTAAPAVKLAFVTQPGNATAGSTIDPAVSVAIEDGTGHPVPGDTGVVTMWLSTGAAGDTLTEMASVAAMDGVASFPDLRIDKAGTAYTLQATATGLTSATSTGFTVSPATASHLVFAVQPSNTLAGTAILPAIQVAAQDPYGNVATGFQDSVFVTLGNTATSAALSGTTAARAIGGMATFSDLSITPVHPGYTLTASAAGLAAVISAPFAIVAPMATLRIMASTLGSELDPDGYLGCIDPASTGGGGFACGYGGPVSIAVNGYALAAVDTGAHAVLLEDIAPNCTVTGDNPQSVPRAAQGDTLPVVFTVNCVETTLHITTATTGASLDPDGYTVCLDPVPDWDYGTTCTTSEAIGVNDSLTLPVTPGEHDIELTDVAPNCTPSGGGWLTAAGSTDTPFVITCVPAGRVRVTTASTGTDIPAYASACLESSGGCVQVGANADATLDGVMPGAHTVTLEIANNCTVSGGTTRAITVSADVTSDVAFDVVCAPVGLIAFSSGGMITLIRGDGAPVQSITPGTAPAWSPDGTRLAYECGGDICAINTDGTGYRQLTANPAGNYHPTWSPDGSKIAFAATYGGVVDLYVIEADGSGIMRLTQGVGFVGSPAWSPDGTTIVFDCQVDVGNTDLCSVHPDGTGFARLTSDPARDEGAAWKPDGSTLAFATTRYGTEEIVLMSPAGGTVTRIGAGRPGIEPSWSPDGGRLAFVQAAGSSSTIGVIRIDGSVAAGLEYGDHPAWQPQP
jgi:hypothetical protein